MHIALQLRSILYAAVLAFVAACTAEPGKTTYVYVPYGWDVPGIGQDGSVSGVDIKPKELPVASSDALIRPGGCCTTDAQCGTDERCHVTSGVCHPTGSATACWVDADCAPGDQCAGAVVCPCGSACLIADAPGKCATPVKRWGCCGGDAVCETGLDCRDVGAIGKPTCHPKPTAGACYTQSDCAPGALCTGAGLCSCEMNCISNTGTCVSNTGCCGASTECPGGQLCVAGGASGGKCAPALPAGQCWSSAQCGKGMTCEGASLCPCGVACGAPDVPGKCVTPVVPCCKTDADCGDKVCVSGVCKAPLASGACWTNSDCATGQSCEGASLCPCGTACAVPDAPGKCKAPSLPAGCCKSSANCGTGKVCTPFVGIPSSTALGACVPSLSGTQCYTDSDCGNGKLCSGASVCPCGEACDQASTPGKCIVDPKPAGCCGAGKPCTGGKSCFGASTASQGVCLSDPEEGGCYESSDCESGHYCVGAVLCPCGAACKKPSAAGACTEIPSGCCLEDSGCAPGTSCHADGTGLGTCLPPVVEHECWYDDDCEKGEVCLGAVSCPCGATCGVASQPGKCGLSGCVGTNPQGCTLDAQCPADTHCVSVTTCLPSSCTCNVAKGAWECTADCNGGKCL